MRPINKVIIQFVDIENIDALIEKHTTEGMPMVGFHYMIGKDADIIVGRPISAMGNHYMGENAASIGVAIIGKEISTTQKTELDSLIEDIELKAPNAKEVYIVENGELKKYK